MFWIVISMHTTHTFPLILPVVLSIAAFPGESVSWELSLNMEMYELIHILLLLLMVLVEIKIDSKTEATNSGCRNIREKKVEIMGWFFYMPYYFSISSSWISHKLFFSKIPLTHLSCCTVNIKVTRENIRKLGFERVFGKALKNTSSILKGFGCRDFTGVFWHLSLWGMYLVWNKFLFVCLSGIK